MSIYSNDFQTTLGDMSNPLRLSGIYGNLTNSSLYSADPTEPGLFNILGGLVTQGANSMKDNLRASLKDRAITPYANDLTKLTAMKDKTGDFQFLKNNMTSNLSGLEDWLLDARRDNGINNAIDTVNREEGVSWLDNYKASVSGMPVNDVLHGAKNLDSLYDLAGKGRTGGEMLDVKNSANKAVQYKLVDMLKPEIQSAVDDAALRGEMLTPAAVINSGSPIISDLLNKLGVDPRIANNRQIIDPVRDSLFTQYSKAVGTGGALKPEDVRAWETKKYAVDRLNKYVMNSTDYDANRVTGTIPDDVVKSLGYTSREELNKSVTNLMQQRFLQNPDVMDFREKMLNNKDNSFILSQKFMQVLARAEEFDRINSTSGNNSMVTRITGQPNYVKQLKYYADILKPTSSEDTQKQTDLYRARDFYHKVQEDGRYNPVRASGLKGISDESLNSMKNTVTKVANEEKVILNDDLIELALEYYTSVLDDDSIKVPYRYGNKPDFKGDDAKWQRARSMLSMYLLNLAVNMKSNTKSN